MAAMGCPLLMRTAGLSAEVRAILTVEEKRTGAYFVWFYLCGVSHGAEGLCSARCDGRVGAVRNRYRLWTGAAEPIHPPAWPVVDAQPRLYNQIGSIP